MAVEKRDVCIAVGVAIGHPFSAVVDPLQVGADVSADASVGGRLQKAEPGGRFGDFIETVNRPLRRIGTATRLLFAVSSPGKTVDHGEVHVGYLGKSGVGIVVILGVFRTDSGSFHILRIIFNSWEIAEFCKCQIGGEPFL